MLAASDNIALRAMTMRSPWPAARHGPSTLSTVGGMHVALPGEERVAAEQTVLQPSAIGVRLTMEVDDHVAHQRRALLVQRLAEVAMAQCLPSFPVGGDADRIHSREWSRHASSPPCPAVRYGGRVTLRVEVVEDRCISSGRCVGDAPEAFAFDDDELATPLPGAARLDRRRLVELARNCPGEAIVVYDDDVAIPLD